MNVDTLCYLIFTVSFAIVSFVAVVRCARVEFEYKNLRAEIERSERDEALLEEAKRFTLATVKKSIELNVQQYECLKEHNLL